MNAARRDVPADPGLQPERTELAWRRTLLALAAASLASVRVLAEPLGGLALAVGAAGLVHCAVLAVATRKRFRTMRTWFLHAHAQTRAAQASDAPPGNGGRLPLTVALGATAWAAAAFTYLFGR